MKTIFTDNLLEKMDSLIDESNEIGIELGTILCIDKKGNMYNTCISRGIESGCNIETLKYRDGDTRFGGFHTHPIKLSNLPTLIDLFPLEEEKSIAERLGYTEGNIKTGEHKIVCYIRKSIDEMQTKEKFNIFENLLELEKELLGSKKEVSRETILEFEEILKEFLNRFYITFEQNKYQNY